MLKPFQIATLPTLAPMSTHKLDIEEAFIMSAVSTGRFMGFISVNKEIKNLLLCHDLAERQFRVYRCVGRKVQE